MALLRGFAVVFHVMFLLEMTTTNENIDTVLEEFGISERIDNYPTQLVKNLIKELKSKNTLFRYNDAAAHDDNDDEDDLDVDYFSPRSNNNRQFQAMTPDFPILRSDGNFKRMNARPSSNNDVVDLCDFRVQYITPRIARDNNGIMRFILNDDEYPVQRFESQICSVKTSSCAEYIGFIPGYKGVCVQNVGLREMIYVDERTNGTAIGYFKVPSCCSCKLVHTL